MTRGRKSGQGNFVGGRPKGSPNKKGSFGACLPPVRCSQELFNWASQQANASNKSLSTWLRDFLETKKYEENEIFRMTPRRTTGPFTIRMMNEGGCRWYNKYTSLRTRNKRMITNDRLSQDKHVKS
jgi:hypothetical protein